MLLLSWWQRSRGRASDAALSYFGDRAPGREPGYHRPMARATVRSDDPHYFQVVAAVGDGRLTLLGERYDADGRRVLLVTDARPRRGGLDGLDEGDRRSITIGREFFTTALKDYKDWKIKWWREAIQNAVDAGAKHVALHVTPLPDQQAVHVVCDDDGDGMDEDTIINKFLVLGGTTKVQGTTAGGFGKAKELLLLPWISWRLHSRSTLVEGSGIDYSTSSAPPRKGTWLEVLMPEDNATSEAAAIAFVQKSYLPDVRFTVNGTAVRAALVGKELLRSFPEGVDLYLTRAKEKQSELYVRTKGLFMFERYVGEVSGYLLADLTRSSVDLLTANRDGFRDWQVGVQIDQFVERLAKDTRSALEAKAGLIRQKFTGSGKFVSRRLASEILEQIGPVREGESVDVQKRDVVEMISRRREADDGPDAKPTALPSRETTIALIDQKFTGPTHVEAAMQQLVWQPDFYVVNEVSGFRVPKKFFPATMTPGVLKLAKTWTELCRYVLMQLGSDARYGVGFLFSYDAAAAAVTEKSDEGTEKWLMLNPFRNMNAVGAGGGKIWHATIDADLKWLYAAAIHECTHVADHISYHDESFSSAFTLNVAKCANGYRKIRQIVGGIKMHGSAEAD